MCVIPLVFVLRSTWALEGSVWMFLWKHRIPGLLFNSFLLVSVVTTGALVLGFLLAWLVEKTDLPGHRWLRPLLAAPLVIPCYITAICYIGLFGSHGLAERFIGNWWPGVEIPAIYGFWGAAAMLILGTYPYIYTITVAAVRGLDPSLLETARCLGAGRLKRLRRVIIPVLTPAFTAGVVLSALYVLSDFGVVTLLRYRTFVSAIYDAMSGRYDFQTASALSAVLVLFTFAFIVLQEGLRKKRPVALVTARTGAVTRTHLGTFRYPALGFVLFVITVGLVVPVCVLTGWLLADPASAGPASLWRVSFPDMLRSGLSSLPVSASAATAVLVLSLPLAYWTVRQPRSWPARAMAWTAQSGLALPGVLIALGLGLFLSRFAPPLSYSVAAIILAFFIHFFAQGFQATSSGLAQLSPHLEESARLLGLSPLESFWRVGRIILKPSLWAGWILVFLSSMRELPVALVLRPAGFDTLTVKVWNAASEGFYPQAAGPALMLVAISIPLVFVILKGGGGRSAYASR